MVLSSPTPCIKTEGISDEFILCSKYVELLSKPLFINFINLDFVYV